MQNTQITPWNIPLLLIGSYLIEPTEIPSAALLGYRRIRLPIMSELYVEAHNSPFTCARSDRTFTCDLLAMSGMLKQLDVVVMCSLCQSGQHENDRDIA